MGGARMYRFRDTVMALAEGDIWGYVDLERFRLQPVVCPNFKGQIQAARNYASISWSVPRGAHTAAPKIWNMEHAKQWKV